MSAENKEFTFTEADFERLDALTSGELDRLIVRAQEAREKAVEREVEEVFEAMRKAAEERGVDLKAMAGNAAFAKMISEMTGSIAPAAPSSGEEPVRFRHPKNPSLTWTGRGRLPFWLKEKKEAGEDIEDYRVAP